MTTIIPEEGLPWHTRCSNDLRESLNLKHADNFPPKVKLKHAGSINTPCLESYTSIHTQNYHLILSDRDKLRLECVLFNPGPYSRKDNTLYNKTKFSQQSPVLYLGQQDYRRAGWIGGLIIQLRTLGHYGRWGSGSCCAWWYKRRG